MSHALVIGGTGMLRGVTRELAKRFDHVSVVARSKSDLDTLEKEKPGAIHGIAVDYRNETELRALIRGAVSTYGNVTLVVAWIHEDGSVIPHVIVESAGDAPLTFVHVLGSASADPSRPDLSIRKDMEHSCVAYHEAILGFVLEGNHSRWLSHGEISAGVLKAIETGAPRSIIGTVEPWSRRP
jgi:NAD(P)-dependent dehydrogenase (short-subunit alcohol dehydrogenase family)